MCRVVALLLVLVIGGGAGAAPVPKSVKRNSHPDGRWRLVEFRSAGEPRSVDGMIPVWQIDGEALYVGPPTERNHWQFTIPDKSRPDLRRFAPGKQAAEHYHAVIEVDGDRMRFCYGLTPRTVVTECVPAANVHYYVFARLKPGEDPPAGK